jgi:hypothetical protein
MHEINGQVFIDKILKCLDCGESFVFTAGEQAYFRSKSLSAPRRCQPCRNRRKRTLLPDPEVCND